MSYNIDKPTKELLEEKIVLHRQRFIEIFKGRYLELIPSLIFYKNGEHTSIDFLKLEVALRNGYDVVIGETTKRTLQIIGYTNSKLTNSDPSLLWEQNDLKHGQINFIIPEHLRLDYYKEITYQDDCKTGNFIVVRNKTLNYVPDVTILNHYIDELAEIVVSRFSISMQIKINTLFLGEANDETLNQLVTRIYNGSPFLTMNKFFDPDDQIYHMQNNGLASNFAELKREYQNKIAELNNMLGINSLAVEKESGVSDSEAESNRGFTVSNSNVYIDSRCNAFKKMNARYGTNIVPMYNDEVKSEIENFTKVLDLKDGGSNGNNDNTI